MLIEISNNSEFIVKSTRYGYITDLLIMPLSVQIVFYSGSENTGHPSFGQIRLISTYLIIEWIFVKSIYIIS